MEKSLPIILASHGPFAQGALACAEMLIGKQQNMKVISVLIDSNLDELRQQMVSCYQSLNQGNGVIILVDLMGGTPCNLAAELTIKHDDVLLFCGFNIPVLLEVLNNRKGSIAEVKTIIEEIFPLSGFDVSKVFINSCEKPMEL